MNADDVTCDATAKAKDSANAARYTKGAEILAGGYSAGVLIQVEVAPATKDDVLAALV